MKTQKQKAGNSLATTFILEREENAGVSQTVTEKAKRYSYLNMPRRLSTIKLKSHLTFLCKKIDNKCFIYLRVYLDTLEMTSMPVFANEIHVISPQIMTTFKLLKKTNSQLVLM